MRGRVIVPRPLVGGVAVIVAATTAVFTPAPAYDGGPPRGQQALAAARD